MYLFLMSLFIAEAVFSRKSSSLLSRSLIHLVDFGPCIAVTLLFMNDFFDGIWGRNPNLRNLSIVMLLYMPGFACLFDTKCTAITRQIAVGCPHSVTGLHLSLCHVWFILCTFVMPTISLVFTCCMYITIFGSFPTPGSGRGTSFRFGGLRWQPPQFIFSTNEPM